MGWNIVVCSTEGIDELRRAPDEYLSFAEATTDVRNAPLYESMSADSHVTPCRCHLQALQVNYTLGPAIMTNPYHIAIVRSNLTRALGGVFPELRDEIIHSFKAVIPETDGAPIEPKLVLSSHAVCCPK